MPTALPILQPVPIFKNKDYRDVMRREMDGLKIPISLGKTCPVKCEFCYEIDHSYRETLDPPKTTDEDWKFIMDYINSKPSDPMQFWCLGGNEYMEWTDLFLHPKAMEWVEDFLVSTDKNITFFTVGYVQVPKIHELAARFPGRINFELSVITLSQYRERLMPHAPSIKHLMKVLDGPAVSSANFYAFDSHTMSKDAETISKINQKCILWMGCLTPVRGIKDPTADLMRQGRKFLAEEAVAVVREGPAEYPDDPNRGADHRLHEPETDRECVRLIGAGEARYGRDGEECVSGAEHVPEESSQISHGPECHARRRFRLFGVADVRRHCPADHHSKACPYPEVHDAIGPWSLHGYRRGDAGAVHEENRRESHGAPQDRYEVCEQADLEKLPVKELRRRLCPQSFDPIF